MSVYYWVCKISKHTVYYVMPQKLGKKNRVISDKHLYILLELSLYEAKADSDKLICTW